MRRKDIVVGEEYAIFEYNRFYRCKIEKIERKRGQYGAESHWRVHWKGACGSESCTLAQVKMLWSEYEPIRAEKARLNDIAVVADNARKAHRESLKVRLRTFGVHVSEYGPIQLSDKDAEKLINALEMAKDLLEVTCEEV